MHSGVEQLYRYLSRHSQRQGGKRFLWRYLKRIAADLQVTVRTVQRRMKKLVELGLVVIEPTFFRHGGRSANRYVLVREVELGGDGGSPWGHDISRKPLSYHQMVPLLGSWLQELLSGYEWSENQLLAFDRRLRRLGPMPLEAWKKAAEQLIDDLHEG